MSSRTERRAKAPYELAFVDRVMLVLEDSGGEPLQRLLLDPPMEVGRFLRRAIGIAMALGKLHERGLVHKDIKQVNILVNGATGDARLTGSTLHLVSPASDRRASLPRIAG